MPRATPFDQFAHTTNKQLISVGLVLIRVVLGAQFLLSGWTKLTNETWSATGYLSQATGPFAEWFLSLVGNPLVDSLNIYGQIAIGLALILGIFVRPAAVAGLILMGLYYLAQFEQNTAHGLIDDHVVYACLFLLMMAGGFGQIWGLDGMIGRQPSLQKKFWSRLFFG